MKAKFLALVGLLFTGSLAFATNPETVNVIKFGDANTLFVGDSKSATLYAYTITPNNNADAQKAYNIHDLSTRIATFAKAGVMDLLFEIWQ